MVTEQRLSVHRCTHEDASSLRDLRLEALRDSPDAFGTTYEAASQWTLDEWAMMAGGWNFYLGDVDRHLAGMASGGSHDIHPGTLWLFAMYVSVYARGSGLAQELLDAVVTWARAEGGTVLYLHVSTRAPRARAFYEKVGFRSNGEVMRMTRDPSIELVTMVKSLG